MCLNCIPLPLLKGGHYVKEKSEFHESLFHCITSWPLLVFMGSCLVDVSCALYDFTCFR